MSQRESEMSADGLCWYRVKVHAVVRPGVGWYGCFHIVASSKTGVEQIVQEFGAYVGLRSLSVEKWYQCEPAHSHELPGLRQQGGQIHYDETVEADPSEELLWSVLREPFGMIDRWLWRRKIRRFNSRIRRQAIL